VPGESLGEVMTRADRALRQAKIAGKNRVVVANLRATQSA
jgi:PleD family two-component response regulator